MVNTVLGADHGAVNSGNLRCRLPETSVVCPRDRLRLVEKYRQLLRIPGAARFVTAGFIGRLPIAMISLGIVLLVTAQGGDYATAGMLTATFALAQAFISPLGLRWVDRVGQSATIPWLIVAEAIGLALFTVSVILGWPLVVQFVLAGISGACSPHIGSLVRARWAALLSGSPQLSSAFALEAVVDELVFIVGPLLVVSIALWFGEPVAMSATVVLLLIGSLWLVGQRSTQPAPHRVAAQAKPERMWSLALSIMLGIMVLLGGVFGAFEVTTVAFTRELGQEGATGVVLALYAGGSLIAGLVLGARPPLITLRSQTLLAATLLAAVGLPLIWVTDVWWLALLSFLAGSTVAPVLITTTGMVERAVPVSRITEALGLTISGLAVGFALGSTISGALVDQVSANAGFLLMVGCGMGLCILTAIGYRALRTTDQPRRTTLTTSD